MQLFDGRVQPAVVFNLNNRRLTYSMTGVSSAAFDWPSENNSSSLLCTAEDRRAALKRTFVEVHEGDSHRCSGPFTILAL